MTDNAQRVIDAIKSSDLDEPSKQALYGITHMFTALCRDIGRIANAMETPKIKAVAVEGGDYLGAGWYRHNKSPSCPVEKFGTANAIRVQFDDGRMETWPAGSASIPWSMVNAYQLVKGDAT